MELHVKGFDPNRVRQARLEAGLSQEDLARESGCSTRSIQHWEAGEVVQQPRARYVRRLAQVTGKPTAWFYGTEAA
jgi:transcriptional regulator with XRE-family HTH domain